ncbi:MAG: FAD-binding oxidoreductase, partial [Candidatus Velthaea sp.]
LMHGDADARRLAQQTFLIGDFLAQHAPDFRVPPLHAKAVVHGHCHQKAVLGTSGDEALLKQMKLDYTLPDTGCCGMAGGFGFERGAHYDVSIKCGERVLLPAVRAASADTLVVANGFSCREQIAQTTERQALHLAQVVKMALDGTTPGPRPELHAMRDIAREARDATLRGFIALAVAAGAASALVLVRRR